MIRMMMRMMNNYKNDDQNDDKTDDKNDDKDGKDYKEDKELLEDGCDCCKYLELIV